MTVKRLSRVACFGGWQDKIEHHSDATNCTMTASVYLPPVATAANATPVPVMTWLSGLTCTDENFTTKAGAQLHAARHGIALVAPDTSPRGDGVPDDPAYDFGQGAGFYVAATQAPWAQHYQMYDYIRDELPRIIAAEYPTLDMQRQSISGHSMGGHGALTIALKNPQQYRAVSAFAPIVSPMHCPWGQKVLSGYLGDNQADWQQYDTCALVQQAANAEHKFHLLVEQGLADPFLSEQLKPELLETACANANYPLTLNRHPDYDHSYYFIASFIGNHIAFHAEQLAS